MALLRKTQPVPYQNPEHISPEFAHDPDVGGNIMHTYRELGLDPERSVLVGSSALYMHGIKLSAYWDDKPRPGDIDVALPTSHLADVARVMQTPGGVAVRHKDIPGLPAVILTTMGVDGVRLPLSVDLINRYNPDRHGKPEYYDSVFDATPYALIGDTGLRVATLGVLLRELETRSRQGDPKAIRDYNTTATTLAKEGLDVGQLRKVA